MWTSHGGLSAPDFMVDQSSAVRGQSRQIDWAVVGPEYRETPGGTVTASAEALANATAIPVTALAFAIPAGTILDFGAKKFAELTANAAKGAVSLAVEALATTIASGNTAVYAGVGPKTIPHGTAVHTNVSTGKIYPRTAAAAASGLLEGPAQEGDDAAPLTGYGLVVGGVVYETFIPNISATVKNELLAAGGQWVFEAYVDDRAS